MPDTKGRGADPLVMMDAVLGTDENFEFLADAVGTWGAFAGHRAVYEDGKWTSKGRVVPDELPRARRFARLRGKSVLRQEFGELEAARHVLTQLVKVIDDIDAEDDRKSEGRKKSCEISGALATPRPGVTSPTSASRTCLVSWETSGSSAS